MFDLLFGVLSFILFGVCAFLVMLAASFLLKPLGLPRDVEAGLCSLIGIAGGILLYAQVLLQVSKRFVPEQSSENELDQSRGIREDASDE